MGFKETYWQGALDRRSFINIAAGVAATTGLLLTGCQTQDADTSSVALQDLPVSSPDPSNEFGVDLNINVGTIDNYIGRADVIYRDVRMLIDTADYASIGGNADLATTIEGFRIASFPYIGTLPDLPVDGKYVGDTLFDVVWNWDERTVVSATPNYKESIQLLEEVFPKDKPILLICGGGGYAGMAKILLTFLGWDESKLYNCGGFWGYTGAHGIDLVTYDSKGTPTYRFWRADYTLINFLYLTPIEGRSSTSAQGTNGVAADNVPFTAPPIGSHLPGGATDGYRCLWGS